jgi:hypothetical protein
MPGKISHLHEFNVVRMTSASLAEIRSDTGPRAFAQAAPAASVVVPCYNGGRFIDQLLGSLSRQTFRDFEIVIVNDGSTDKATLAKLASLDPAIRVIHQENRGLSGARNSGIAAAKSDLVLVLDCDDEIEPSYLAEAVPLLRDAAPEVGFVFTHTRLAGISSGYGRRHFNPFTLLFSNTLPSCLILRRQACQAVGGYDEAMRDGYEDWEFCIRLTRAGFRGIEIAKPLAVYNSSADGMLLGKATRLHAKLWRYIRIKHADAYRLPSLLRLWWVTPRKKGDLPLVKALAAYALAVLLPESWFSGMFGAMRRWRLKKPAAQPELSAAGPPQSLSA